MPRLNFALEPEPTATLASILASSRNPYTLKPQELQPEP